MVDLIVDSAAFRDNQQLIAIAVRQYLKEHPEVDRWAALTNDSITTALAYYIAQPAKPLLLTIPNRYRLWLPITEPNTDIVRWCIEQTGVPHAKSKPTKTWQTKYPDAYLLWITLREPSDFNIAWMAVQRGTTASTGRKYELITDTERLIDIIVELTQRALDTGHDLPVALDFETVGDYPYQIPVGYSFSFVENEGYYVPLAHKEAENADRKTALDLLHNLTLGPWIAHNSIFELHCLENLGITPGNPLPEDTMTLAWHLSLPRGLKALSAQVLNRKRETYEDIAKGRPFDEVPLSEALAYACDDAIDSLILWRMWNECG